jgi:hypothetical protein
LTGYPTFRPQVIRAGPWPPPPMATVRSFLEKRLLSFCYPSLIFLILKLDCRINNSADQKSLPVHIKKSAILSRISKQVCTLMFRLYLGYYPYYLGKHFQNIAQVLSPKVDQSAKLDRHHILALYNP